MDGVIEGRAMKQRTGRGEKWKKDMDENIGGERRDCRDKGLEGKKRIEGLER